MRVKADLAQIGQKEAMNIPASRLALCAVLCTTAPFAAWPSAGSPLGRALVQANCARCHAIGRDDESTHPEAPPFRDLHMRYPLEALEEAFVEGISVGHTDMPEFVATPEQIGAIIDYIGTISP